MTAVLLVSLASVAVSVRCFGDQNLIVPAVPLVSLVSVAVSVRCFGDSACSASSAVVWPGGD